MCHFQVNTVVYSRVEVGRENFGECIIITECRFEVRHHFTTPPQILLKRPHFYFPDWLSKKEKRNNNKNSHWAAIYCYRRKEKQYFIVYVPKWILFFFFFPVFKEIIFLKNLSRSSLRLSRAKKPVGLSFLTTSLYIFFLPYFPYGFLFFHIFLYSPLACLFSKTTAKAFFSILSTQVLPLFHTSLFYFFF